MEMKMPKEILNPKYDDTERIASIESELKALKKLINLVLEKLDIE